MAPSYGYFEKYAGLLDEGDLLNLFDVVKSRAGSLSEAARRCGIERKTIYDMMSEGKEVKRRTKERILRAALTANLEKSIGLLLSKTVKESKEILVSHLSLIYQDAMRAKDPSDFLGAASRFEEVMDQNAGLVAGTLQEEVSSMVGELVTRSSRLAVTYAPPTLRVMGSETMAAAIPGLIGDLLTTPGIDPNDLARKWRIGPGIVAAAHQAVTQHNARFRIHSVEPLQVLQAPRRLAQELSPVQTYSWSPISIDRLESELPALRSVASP
jgi:DNA-binding phage protein